MIGDQRGSLELSMYVKAEKNGDPLAAHELQSGGQPLEESALPRLVQVELWRPGRSMSEGVRVEQAHLLRHGKGGFRLWLGDRPASEAVPTLTANRMKNRPVICFP